MSESVLGKVIEDGYREKVHLATRLPSWLVTSKEDMDRYLNKRLERLKTNYIYFYCRSRLFYSRKLEEWFTRHLKNQKRIN